MKQLAMLYFVALAAIFLLAGCGGGAQAKQEQHHVSQLPPVHSAKLDLHPVGDSGVSGTVSLRAMPHQEVIVKLELRGLPKPNTMYLSHIHPGSCAQEKKEGETYENGENGEHHEEGGKIDYPLTQVKSDSEGRESSTSR